LNKDKTGVVAFDRVKFLPWKDYNAIAKGEAVIEPHIGNVDSVQWTIDKKWYNSTEFPETDLARLKNEPLYRAKYIASIAKTLASSLDGELFDLLISAAMGQKDAVIEMEFPEKFDPTKLDIYVRLADIVTELEKKISSYYMGIQRKQILIVVEPKLYTRMIRGLLGTEILMKEALDFIQNEEIRPTIISGIPIVRHVALDYVIIGQASNEFNAYNFKGIRAIIYHIATPWIVQIFNSTNGVINKDTGNYRMIQRILWDKGLVYGDLIRVIKDPSTKDKPLQLELNLVKNRDKYNSIKGFKDLGIQIPSTVALLQANYRKISTSTTGENSSTTRKDRSSSEEVEDNGEDGKVREEKELIAPGNSVGYQVTDWHLVDGVDTKRY